MSTLPGVAESTYRMCYKGELSALPLIKYKKLPCMYSTEPYSRRIGDEFPKLKRAFIPVPQTPKLPAPGKPRAKSGTKRTSAKSGAKRVLNTKFGPMDMATIEKLHDKYKYTTFTQKAAEEYCLPVQKMEPPKTVLEPKPDMIRLYGQRYECRPEEWQEAVLWDRLQSRYPTNGRPRTPGKEKLLRRGEIENRFMVDKSCQNKIQNLVLENGPTNAFVRKCPGYAGYKPLCPPETQNVAKRNPTDMTTLMTSSFRQLPNNTYRRQLFARNTPFSHTVTLTYPFNPFNKVGEEIISIDKAELTENYSISMTQVN